MTSLSINRLIPNPPGEIVSGKIIYKNINILESSAKEIQQIRGNKISTIFQEPMTSLNPSYTIGNQLEEAMLRHHNVGREEARDRAVFLLEKVGITAARSRLSQYPHQLSGGLRQRVMIAMSIANNPDLLIADEPTTALDVTVQSQILDLIKNLQQKYN